MTEDMRDDDLLAAEYVLGVLPLAERIAAERRRDADPTFARMILDWQQRLLPLNDEIAPVAPSALVLHRIEGRLFPKPARRSWLGPLWAGAGVVFASFFVALFFWTVPPKPLYTATLAANDSAVSYLAEVSQDGITLTLSGPAPDAAQVHQLWLIAGEAAPVSLGLIGSGPLPLPAALAPGMILAVSLEPAGGSTTGAPTGPVLALGPLEGV